MESSISRLLTTGKFLILDLKTKKKVYSENKIMLGKKKQLLTFLKHNSASFRSGWWERTLKMFIFGRKIQRFFNNLINASLDKVEIKVKLVYTETHFYSFFNSNIRLNLFSRHTHHPYFCIIRNLETGINQESLPFHLTVKGIRLFTCFPRFEPPQKLQNLSLIDPVGL